MPIVITDEDAERLLSIPEAVEAMEVAFRDLAEGRAVNPPRLRYDIASPDPAHSLLRQYPCRRGGDATASPACAPARISSRRRRTPSAATGRTPIPSTGP